MSAKNASPAILDAAEHIFALYGFDGASMRQIAREAGVAQALLHYHFGTKEKLFEAVFADRSGAINAERAAQLDRLFELDGQGQPGLEELIEALFRPTVEFGHGRRGNDFARILAATANADDERSRSLIAAHYDGIAQRFISAFRRVVPSLSSADAVWSYMFAIGVGITMMAPTGRASRLSGGACDDGHVDAILARLVPFVTAGIQALAAFERCQPKIGSDRSRRTATRRR